MKNILLILLILLDVISVYSQIDTLYHPTGTIISLEDPYISLEDSSTSKILVYYRAEFDSIAFTKTSFRPNNVTIQRAFIVISQKKKMVSLPLDMQKKIENILCEKYYFVKEFGMIRTLHPLLLCIIHYNSNVYNFEDV